VQAAGEKLASESTIGADEIAARLKSMLDSWDELHDAADRRSTRLEQALAYRQFLAAVEEEEAWIVEKQHVLAVDDRGDNLAAVQGLLKKHDAFETDLQVHSDRCAEIERDGEKLIGSDNHYADSIAGRCGALKERLEGLGRSAELRKHRLVDNSAFLHFLWKTDVVENWIGELRVALAAQLRWRVLPSSRSCRGCANHFAC